MSEYSDQEISLRPYIEAVFSNWVWILGPGLLLSIVAYVLTASLATPTYQATALVSINEPNQRVQFDSRIVSVQDEQPLRAYPEIAMSDSVLFNLKNETAVGERFSFQQLQGMLEATPGRDPTVIRLTATNQEPDVAAELVNEWAAQFVAWANIAYGTSNEDQLLFFENRLQEAAADLELSEKALIDYQAENRIAIMENELEALQRMHADLLAKEGNIETLLAEIASLLSNASNDGGDNSLLDNDPVTAVILKLRAFGGLESDALNNSPLLQLQLNTNDTAANNQATVQEQLLNLQAILESQQAQTAEAILALEPQILTLQAERQEALATESLMLRNRNLAEETHQALAREVEERRITSQETNSGVSLVSRASFPVVASSPRELFNALAAFVGVALSGTLFTVFVTWWRSSNVVEPAIVARDDDNESAVLQPKT
ncbi:MAG: Wzz/FepE/Etk N-terminal domain-containing protein [Chloroflexota bacterium]